MLFGILDVMDAIKLRILTKYNNIMRAMSKRNNAKRIKYTTASDVRNIIIGNAELKRFVSISSGNSNSTAGVVNNLTNAIVQGDDLNMRTGDQLKVQKHTLHVKTSAITVNQSFRFILFKDNTNRGSTPTVTEVLNTANYLSQYSPVTKQQHRFTILHDFMLNCNVAGESIKSRVVTSKGHRVNYNGSTAVAASNGPGAIFVLCIGDSLTGQFDFSYECVYLDL